MTVVCHAANTDAEWEGRVTKTLQEASSGLSKTFGQHSERLTAVEA